ncbi:MAG: FkbM family methyltransferase [Beijerinckiaceae bacterium]|nr:FkbM family methyltransferase [Beijerinckiaceae bacterium]
MMRGKPLSYSQNLEDFQLALAFAGQEAGFYIDIGGGHPIADNVSLWFYERGWSGIVVEPQEKLAALYPLLRPRDICEAVLIGETPGAADFHVFDRFHGLSSTVADSASAALHLGEQPRIVSAPMLTLAELCERHGVIAIDFLKVDVEGAELAVLKGNDWRRFRPKIIVLEAIAPGTNLPAWEVFEPFLLAQGYSFALFDTLNRFYVANEHPELLASFAAGRADWQAATHMYEIGRAPFNAEHPEHGLSRDLARGLWASLPMLDPALLAALVTVARNGSEADKTALADYFTSEAGRLALGRIACGFDGGQIHDDDF